MKSIQSPHHLYANRLGCRKRGERILITTKRPVFRATALLFVATAAWMTFGTDPEIMEYTSYRVTLGVIWLATAVFSACFALPHDRLILDSLLRRITVESGIAFLYMRKRVLPLVQIDSVAVQEGRYLTDRPENATLTDLAGEFVVALVGRIGSAILPRSLHHEAVYGIRIHCRNGTEFVTHQCWSRDYVAEAVSLVDRFRALHRMSKASGG